MARAIGRTVHFYDHSSPDSSIGGLVLNPSFTQANFLTCLDILIIAPATYEVRRRGSGQTVARIDSRLEPGEYDIMCPEAIVVNDEIFLQRTTSYHVTGRDERFRRAVRDRDGKCVITGVVNRSAYRGDWSAFEAAHVFPLAFETWWLDNGYSRWITDIEEMGGGSGINSRQNGMLLKADVHKLFDNYLVAINPDDGYKVTSFDDDSLSLDGRVLDLCCRGNISGVRNQSLRWHFRQCVIANMRGAGEPIFENDFPPGTDMVREIVSGRKNGVRIIYSARYDGELMDFSVAVLRVDRIFW